MLTRLTFSIALICSSFGFTSVAANGARKPPEPRKEIVRPIHHPVVPWSIWLKVLKVHNCEEPAWNIKGPIYSGGLGWRNELWAQFRAPFMPLNMGDTKPLWQAWAMAHFIEKDNGGYWPDQSGCSGGY
jgi:hypothetical protein